VFDSANKLFDQSEWQAQTTGLVVAKASTARWYSKKSSSHGVIPGLGSQYGSLGEPKLPKAAVAWQAGLQRVTQHAMIYELTQEQTRTIEEVVP
jgi:hypothetical protein